MFTSHRVALQRDAIESQIIPQCVTESELHGAAPNKSNSQKIRTLPLRIEDEVIGDIGATLRRADPQNANHTSIELKNGGYYQFFKKLVQIFNELRRNLRKNHGRRYIFIIDRRNPQCRDSPNYQSIGRKNWNDTLHVWCPSGPQYQKFSELPSRSDLFPEALIDRTMECMLPLSDGKRIGAKDLCNGHMFTTSYHLFEADRVKTYFMSNGHCQRFTHDEYQYYWPRLFMKVNGKFQDETGSEDMMMEHRRELDDYFKRHADREHLRFKKYTMTQIINAEPDGQ